MKAPGANARQEHSQRVAGRNQGCMKRITDGMLYSVQLKRLKNSNKQPSRVNGVGKVRAAEIYRSAMSP